MKLPKARTENLLEQNLKNETLIYDLRIDKAFNLNETSTIVYLACGQKLTFDELKRKHKFSDEFIYLALDELRRMDRPAVHGAGQVHLGAAVLTQLIRRRRHGQPVLVEDAAALAVGRLLVAHERLRFPRPAPLVAVVYNHGLAGQEFDAGGRLLDAHKNSQVVVDRQTEKRLDRQALLGRRRG